MRKLLPVIVALVLIGALWQLPVWDQGVERVSPDEQPRVVGRTQQPSGELPPGHPPLEGGGSQAASNGAPAGGSGGAPVDPSTLSLTPTGLGSEQELSRALPKIQDQDTRDRFADAFRLTFTTQRDARDYGRAKGELEQIVKSQSDLAEAYRALAYCEFNLTMSFPRTISLYEQAIDLDPDYGEAHYALAFMLGANEPERGAIHFARAMELGIEDERNLRDRFFQGVD